MRTSLESRVTYSSRPVDRKIRDLGKGIEVAVVVIDLRTGLETRRRDEAIDGAPNGETPAPGHPVQIRRRLEGLDTARAQDRVSQEACAYPIEGVLVANRLKNFAIHDVDQPDRCIGLEQFGQVPVERRTPSLEEVDPDGRVDDDHGRRRRSSARSPSHFTLPRIERRSRRRAPFKSSTSAR